jgi:hypothetical protein
MTEIMSRLTVLAEGIMLSEQMDLPGAAPAIRAAPGLLSSAPIRLNPVYAVRFAPLLLPPSSADRRRGI